MKKLSILLCGLFLTVSALGLQAQEQQLPVDPQVRYGKLANGLTYYIRHNEQPKERADFYIAQRVGSMQEEDSQAGLAHFLEHMAFNGTKNFPDKSMINYLESVGVRFGENLNAYTGFDETVYMIMNAPVTRKGIVDSCLLVLHDWSNAISLEDKEIDKERGVIHEEWRTSGDAGMRLMEQQIPVMFQGSKYADRLPIGKMDVVDNFKYDELRNYYKKWYRPDLQAVIIVGDINAEQVENQLKKTFADVSAPVNPAKREMYGVPDNDAPIVSVATDKEASNIILYLYFKHNVFPEKLRNTPQAVVKDYISRVCGVMMNERFDEMLQKADPPFVYAMASDGEYVVSKTKDAWMVAAVAKEGHVEDALAAMARETERIRKFGFTASEYDRARINVLKQYESLYKDRNNQKNSAFVKEYTDHFTNGGYIPGIETEYALINQYAPNITVEQINQYIENIIGDKNIVIALTGPEKDGTALPTKEELLKTFVNTQKEQIEAYQETVSNEPLIENLPKPGKIMDIKTGQRFGATVITLSNGIKVVLKKTDFKEDEILMTATSPGGSTLFGNKDIDNLKVFNSVISLGGLGKFSVTDLNKMLAGKKVSVSSSLGLNDESINGKVSPKDLETLFQLIYLTFTAPRMDNDAYQSFMGRVKAQLQNADLDPMTAFSDTLRTAVYNNNPRAARLKPSDFNNISYPRILEMYRERFENAGDFVFSFTGNINTDSIKPLLEQYLAALPATGKVEKGNSNVAPHFRKGELINIFTRQMETPKATAVNFYSGQMPYTLENAITIRMLKQILDIVYTEKVREDEGGTYGVSVSAQVSSFPEGQTYLQTEFDTDPAKREKLNKIVHDELQRLVNEGPRTNDFEKTKENLIKKQAENLQENSYWLNVLDSYYYKNFDIQTNYSTLLNGITPDNIKAFAQKLTDQGNVIEIVMEPVTP